MTVDGFRAEHTQAFVAFDPATADHFYRAVGWLARRLHVEVRGTERVPSGRAVIVANHAFGWDVIFPMAELWAERHRPVWALGEHLWWRVPFLRRVAAAVGTVDGTQENADRLLSNDELLIVMPGGLREAVKPRELRYHLLWGHRYGFVRAAMRHGAPIVPLASIGPDDLFDFVGDAMGRGERLLGKKFPIPRPAHGLPVPHFVPWRFIFGEPIPCPASRGDSADEETVHRLRREVEGAIHELIEEELAKRAGLDREVRSGEVDSRAGPAA